MVGARAAVMFQHTAARRRLLGRIPWRHRRASFNTQPPEGGCRSHHRARASRAGFNTQPPEGGCRRRAAQRGPGAGFNTQPPEGGCHSIRLSLQGLKPVSTHSRPKAAAGQALRWAMTDEVSTHSRPKAAARDGVARSASSDSFNTQPPEGGCSSGRVHAYHQAVSTHSRPKAAAGDRPAPPQVM